MKRSPRRNSPVVGRIVAAVTLVIVCLTLGGSAVAGRQPAGKVVILVIDRVGLREISESGMPNLKALIKRGGVGVMSVRNVAVDDAPAQYLSIGAGGKAAGILPENKAIQPSDLLEGFAAAERIDNRAATDIYTERTGKRFSAPQAANLSISALVEANKPPDYDAVPGLLGETLHGAGLQTAVVGNADTAGAYGRSVIDLLMDQRGLVDYGYLDKSLLRRDPSFPTGWRSDPELLLAAFAGAYSRADIVAVEWGDTTRVRAESDFLTSGRESTLIKKSLARADLFLGRLLNEIDAQRDLIMILTPTNSQMDIKNNRIVTPVIITGPGIGSGLLTSASTRREAAIVNTDIAPTILGFLHVDQPTEMTGRPAVAGAVTGGSLQAAIDTTDRWVVVRNLMNPMLRGFAYWDIGVLALFMILLLPRRNRPYAVKIRWLLLSIPAIPLAFLLLPLLGYGPTWLVVAEAVALTALISYIAYRVSRTPLEAVGTISLAVTATLLLDLATGARLVQDCILGYSALIGARFYGIGNELSGVLVGAVIIAAFYIASSGESNTARLRQGAAIGLLLVALVMMGAPNLGAEFGTLLASVAGFGLMSLGVMRGGYRPRDVAILVVAGVIGVAAFIGYDVSRGAEGGSHVGRLVSQIQQEGWAPLINVIDRKVSMNVKLIQYAFWNWVNIVSATVLGLAFYGLKNLLKLVLQRYPYFGPAMVGGLFSCVGALLLNDSGVVAMAMIFLYLVPSTLFLVTYEVA